MTANQGENSCQLFAGRSVSCKTSSLLVRSSLDRAQHSVGSYRLPPPSAVAAAAAARLHVFDRTPRPVHLTSSEATAVTVFLVFDSPDGFRFCRSDVCHSGKRIMFFVGTFVFSLLVYLTLAPSLLEPLSHESTDGSVVPPKLSYGSVTGSIPVWRHDDANRNKSYISIFVAHKTKNILSASAWIQ